MLVNTVLGFTTGGGFSSFILVLVLVLISTSLYKQPHPANDGLHLK